MNASYKIALLAAFAVLAIVIAYYAFFSGPEDADPQTGPGAPVAQGDGVDDDGNPPRPGLNNRPSPRPTPPGPTRPGLTPDGEDNPGSEVVIGPPPGERPGGEPELEIEDEPSPRPGTTGGPLVDLPPRPLPGNNGGVADPIDPVVEQTPEEQPVLEERPVFVPEVEPEDEPIVAPQPTPTPTPSPRTYTVQPGDTLSGIAIKVFGREAAWVDIAQANPSVDPLRLRPGQVLALPSQASVEPEPDDEPAPPAPGQNQTYTIQPGDNLSKIADRFYDDPDAWQVIYNRNRDRIGPSPDRLKTGMQLIIPPRYDGAN